MLRGGIVGFGRMGLTHYSILNDHPEVKFVGICDPSSFIREQARWHLKVATFDDHEKMIRSTSPDFLIVSTPTFAHAAPLHFAIENGLHVFVEKPFSLSSKEGRDIVNRLTGKSLVHQVGYVYRFNDVLLNVKDLLVRHAIGELLTFKMEWHGRAVLRPSGTTWRAKRSQGGGCLYDFASHAVDLINYCFGPPERIIGSVLKRIFSRDVEDAVFSTFIYNDGLSGHLLSNWSDATYRKPTLRLEVLGSKGKIAADFHTYKVFFPDEPDIEGFNKGWNTRYITDFVKPVRFYLRGFEYTRQLDHFISRIVDPDQPNVCSFHDGLATDMIIESIVNDSTR